MVAHLLLVPNHGDHSIQDEEAEKMDGDDEDDILNFRDVVVYHSPLHCFHQGHRLLLLVHIAMMMVSRIGQGALAALTKTQIFTQNNNHVTDLSLIY